MVDTSKLVGCKAPVRDVDYWKLVKETGEFEFYPLKFGRSDLERYCGPHDGGNPDGTFFRLCNSCARKYGIEW